ncbi:MAG: hypothetical protein NZ528_07630 [Caldilineales bacterium]|nr:hypothetical protein [Caldilineales bacterium]
MLSLFAWAPLLYPGYLQVHSGFLPVFRTAELAAAGDKLRWLPTLGATLDPWRGDGPLPYWLALVLRPLAGEVAAVKGVLALSILALGVGTLRWVRQALAAASAPPEVADGAGLLAAAVVMLWPPLLATVYLRGALAEAVLLALLPWALGAVSATRSRSWRYAAVAAAALTAALYWTQAGLALWTTGLLLAWSLWPRAERDNRRLAALAVVAGAVVGGGALWLVHGRAAADAPALDVAAHAVYPYQLLIADWRFALSTPDWKNELPLQLGLAALSLAALTTVLAWGGRPTEAHVSSLRPALGFALLAVAALAVVSTTAARFLWRGVPAMAATVTYPWQILGLAGPWLALLAAALPAVERRLAILPALAAAVALTVLSSYPYLAPRFTQVLPDDAARPALFDGGRVTLVRARVGAEALAEQGPVTSKAEAVEAQPVAEEGLPVSLAWQALQPAEFDYNVFIHALDAQGNRVAQWDGQPLRGEEAAPMTTWQVGEVVVGLYRVPVDPAGPPVRALHVGLYNWQSGQRLPVGNDDKVVLEVAP